MHTKAELNLVLGGASSWTASSLGGAGLQACIQAASMGSAFTAEVGFSHSAISTIDGKRCSRDPR
jgi:hypothetical protein